MSIIYEALKKSQKTRAAKKSMPKINMPKISRIAIRKFNRKEVILIAMIFSALFMTLFMMSAKTPPGANTMFSINQPVFKASPVVAQQAAVTRLKLEGVFLSDNERLAMINHRTYHEGDNINGMQIISIAFDRVTLQNKARSMVLRSNVTDID